VTLHENEVSVDGALVTNLAAADLGRFDFFLDIGCFQGFDANQRDVVHEADRTAVVLATLRRAGRWAQVGSDQRPLASKQSP
jgi:hypothetical protein